MVLKILMINLLVIRNFSKVKKRDGKKITKWDNFGER